MDHSLHNDCPLPASLREPSFIQRLDRLRLLAKRLFNHQRQKKGLSFVGRRGLEFSEYRPYFPGDDLRRVDWNVYRRLGQIVVRDYEIEPPLHLLIALDISPSMLIYEKYRWAACLSCALGFIGLGLLDRVTFFPFPQRTAPAGFPVVGKSSLQPLLTYLEPSPRSEKEDIAECFHRLLPQIPSYGTAVIIGDFYDEASLRILPLLQHKNCKVGAVHLVAAQERQPGLSGVWELADSESGQRLRLRLTPALKARYQARLARHLSEVKEFCLHHEIHYLGRGPEDSFEDTALSLLRVTGILR